MARLLFPESGSRRADNTAGHPVPGRTYTVYTDPAGTALADIVQDEDGTPGLAFTGSQVTTDTFGYLPLWWGPTGGNTRLYLTDGTVAPWPVDAVPAGRIDALTGRVVTLEDQDTAAVSSVAGRTGAVVLTASDVSGVETPAGAQAKADAAQSAVTAALDAHEADTIGVHGIPDTELLETVSGAQAKADAAQTAAATDATTKANAAQSAASAASDPVGTAAATVNIHNAATTSVHGIADTTNLETVAGSQAKANAAAAASIPLTQRGAASGVATLGPDGKLVGSQIPAISVVNFLGVVADQAAMLATTGQLGDFVIREDTSTDWVITGGDPTVLGNWTEIAYPSAPVTSVNGHVGSVTVTAGDVGLGNVANLAPADLPVSDDTQAALALKADANNPAFTGAATGLTKAMVGLAAADNTSDANKIVSTLQQAALDLKLTAAANLSDLASAAGARTNLGVPPAARTIGTTAPLTGGGDLSADRTLAISAATTSTVGVVQLAGDLTGTGTAPTIAAGAVTSAKIADNTIVDADISGSAAIAQSKIANLVTDLAAKVAKDSLVVNVEDHAVGNANYLSGSTWYADAGHTITATDDTAAIRALVTGGARNLWFGSKRYRIQLTEGSTFLGWAAANGVTVRGNGAVLCDTTTYTVSPFNPYTPIFELDACTNIRVEGVDYIGPAIASPTVNHGYVGATYVRAKNGCNGITVDAALTSLRYGVESGSYPTETEGYNRNFRIRLRTSFCAYPQAHYLAEGVDFDIDADDVHRVSYLAGCVGVRGTARWKNQYVADTCLLITDAKTGSGTSRGCSSIDVVSIDKGSTVFQLSSACAGIGLSRVDPGIVYQNIKVRVESTSTDTISSTVGGFKLYSGAASLTTPPAPYNWEPSIVLRNIDVSGTLDHSAQTIDGNTAGDVFVRAWDTLPAHAATVDNLTFTDLVIKQSSGNTRALYLEAPGIINQGVRFRNMQAANAKLIVYTSTTVPVTLDGCTLAELNSSTLANRVVLANTSLGALTGVVPTTDTLSSSINGSGAFLRTKTTTLTLSGTAVTWTLAIPAGCLPLAVTGIVTQTITGTSGFKVGTGVDPGKWVNTNTLTAGFSFGPANQAATEQTLWWAGPSALNIIVTAKSATFTAGQLRLCFTYLEFPAPTS